MTITNVSRQGILNWKNPCDALWISIGEEGSESPKNDLITGPRVDMNFWDVEAPFYDLLQNKTVDPISYIQALELCSHLMNAKMCFRNVIVNCRAGKSRSAAICKFAQDHLDFTWIPTETEDLKPNTFVYNSLVLSKSNIEATIKAFSYENYKANL